MLKISPSAPLKGTVVLTGDKSLSHRAALFAALVTGESRIENFLDAGVTRSMLNALEKIGVSWSLDEDVLTVHGKGLAGLTSPASPINCVNSATTMRLLAGVCAASGLSVVLDGSDGLRSRPMNRIVLPLKKMGATINAVNGQAPLVFSGRSTSTLSSASFNLEVASAQVKTCLLLAGLAADGPVRIIEPGPSRDHSERMLAAMGARLEKNVLQEFGHPAKFETILHPGNELNPIRMKLPGDFSSAAFLITAALITPGSELTIRNVGLNPTRTGLLDAFMAMGAHIDVDDKGEQNGEPYGDIHVQYSQLRGISVRGPLVVRMIDEFPTFAVAAALAEGETVVHDAGELRLKESDRIHSICKQLKAIGINIKEHDDGFHLPGNASPVGGIVEPQGDHRIAMALACAGLVSSSPIQINNPKIIHESFPEFIPTLIGLGATIG